MYNGENKKRKVFMRSIKFSDAMKKYPQSRRTFFYIHFYFFNVEY